MKTIHATHEQTNLILRGGKRKKHMKNNKKNTTNSSPSIVLYPSPQWKKRSEYQQAKYHDRMKNNKSFNKKNKNMIYNGNTLSEAKKSVIGKFPDKYKKKVTPYQYNEYIDKYGSLPIDELNNIKDAYLNYYNNKTMQYKEKYEKIMKKRCLKKNLKNLLYNKREERLLVLNSKLKNMNMGGSISQMEKKQFERARMSYIIDQCNQFYKYEYIDGIKQFTYSNTDLI